MSLPSRVRRLERAVAAIRPALAACPVCHGRGGDAVRIFQPAQPGEPTSPPPPPGCSACSRLARSRLTILLRAGMDPANPWGRVPPVHRRQG